LRVKVNGAESGDKLGECRVPPTGKHPFGCVIGRKVQVAIKSVVVFDCVHFCIHEFEFPNVSIEFPNVSIEFPNVSIEFLNVSIEFLNVSDYF